MKHLLSAALVVACVGSARAQDAASLDRPGDEQLMKLSATGVQVYECRAVAGGAPAWAFREPRADLFLDGQAVGTHFAGPSWQHRDGSRIIGKVAASRPASRPEDIPWLRLAVTSTGEGALAGVQVVQRINTRGGALAGSCPQTGAVSEVPYTADYVMLRGTP